MHLHAHVCNTHVNNGNAYMDGNITNKQTKETTRMTVIVSYTVVHDTHINGMYV